MTEWGIKCCGPCLRKTQTAQKDCADKKKEGMICPADDKKACQLPKRPPDYRRFPDPKSGAATQATTRKSLEGRRGSSDRESKLRVSAWRHTHRPIFPPPPDYRRFPAPNPEQSKATKLEKKKRLLECQRGVDRESKLGVFLQFVRQGGPLP